MFRVVTSFNQSYYNQCGKVMINTFKNCFPKSIKMSAYCEDMILPETCKRIKYKNFARILDFYTFKQNFENYENKYQKKINNFSFIYQCIKFSKKVFTILHEEQNCSEDYLIWMDSDIVCEKKITISKLKLLVDADCFFSFLGRNYLKKTDLIFKFKTFSECGFMIFNLKHKKRKKFFNLLKNYYLNGKVFDEDQWHDSYVFDVIRDKILLKKEQLNITDIFLDQKIFNDPLNVLDHSILGMFMKHLKGNKKILKT